MRNSSSTQGRSMMFVSLISILTCIFFFSGCKKVNSQPDSDALKKDLISTIEKFNTAFAESNLAMLNAMTTDNYLHSNGNSKAITKPDWFKYLRKRSARIDSGDLEVLDYTLEDVVMEYHGNTAIVTGKITVITKDSLQTKENAYRVTNLWVYEGGRWKRAGFHDGKIK